MEINTHGRNINMEDLAKASDYTKGLGSRTGEYAEIFYDKIIDIYKKPANAKDKKTIKHSINILS